MSPLFRNSEENTENSVQNTEEAQSPEAPDGIPGRTETSGLPRTEPERQS